MTQNKPFEMYSDFVGEFIGTSLLVFFGCGSVAATILFSAHTGLFQVAAVWGIGVALAIYSTRHLSCAHLNPAVSIAMATAHRMAWRKLSVYLPAQFAGAFFAAVMLYALFGHSIHHYEILHHLNRGGPDSLATAKIFGEFYTDTSLWSAFMAEGIGTFILVFFIFSLTEGCNVGRPDDSLAPLFIGSAVTLIISILAPLTQAGLNPARDLSPRLFAYLAGWGQAAMPDKHYGFLTIYVAGPVCGAILAALLFRHIIEPIMTRKNGSNCGCK